VPGSLRWKIVQAEGVEARMDREVTNMVGTIRGIGFHGVRTVPEWLEELKACLCREDPWRIYPDIRALALLCALTDDDVDKLQLEMAEKLPILAADVTARRDRERESQTLAAQFPDLGEVWAWARRDMSWQGEDVKIGTRVDLTQAVWAPKKFAAAIDPQKGSFTVTPSCMAAAARAAALNGAAAKWLASESIESPEDRTRRLARERKQRERDRRRAGGAA
jgi:hypothetical protein